MAPFNPNNTIRGVRRPNLEVQGGYLSLKGSTFQISNIDKMNMKSEMLVGREGGTGEKCDRVRFLLYFMLRRMLGG